MNLSSIIAQSSSSDGASFAVGGAFLVFMLFYLAVIVFVIAGMWKVFTKAGEPGWAAIIPIYNYWVLIKIAGREPWWIILYFIPCVNIVAAFVISIDLAKSFGKETAYGIGLALLPIVFYPMLGFGDARYLGPAGPMGGGGNTGWGAPYQGQPTWTNQPGQQAPQQPGQPGQWGQPGQQPPPQQPGQWGQQ